MKKLSLSQLAQTVAARRKAQSLSQAALAERTGMNRSGLSRLESGRLIFCLFLMLQCITHRDSLDLPHQQNRNQQICCDTGAEHQPEQ